MMIQSISHGVYDPNVPQAIIYLSLHLHLLKQESCFLAKALGSHQMPISPRRFGREWGGDSSWDPLT